MSAFSILPYASSIRQALDWNALIRMPHYTLSWFFTKIDITLSSGGAWTFRLWLALFGISILAALGMLTFYSLPGVSNEKRQAILFSLVSLIVGSVGTFLFLKTLSYPTEEWYYLTLLALAAVCIDTILGVQTQIPLLRVARIVVVMAVGIGTFIPAMITVRTRLTNVDIVASKLDTTASSSDLVLVNPWLIGVSFNRYYHAPATWTTIPPMNLHRFHRYDLLKSAMMADQVALMRPVIDGMTIALQSGHRVFIVGDLEHTASGEQPLVLPPGPLPSQPYPQAEYSFEWTTMIGDFLEQHARNIEDIPVDAPTRVNSFENLRLRVANGWR